MRTRRVPLITVVLFVAALRPLAAAAQSGARTYDDVTDTSCVRLPPSPLVDGDGRPTGVALHVFGSFSGDDRPKDAIISIGMISSGRTWQFSGDTDRLELTLDGTLMKIPLRHEWTTAESGEVFRQTWAEIAPDVVLRIVQAANFTGRYGPLNFSFTTQQRNAMLALATDLSSRQ